MSAYVRMLYWESLDIYTLLLWPYHTIVLNNLYDQGQTFEMPFVHITVDFEFEIHSCSNLKIFGMMPNIFEIIRIICL